MFHELYETVELPPLTCEKCEDFMAKRLCIKNLLSCLDKEEALWVSQQDLDECNMVPINFREECMRVVRRFFTRASTEILCKLDYFARRFTSDNLPLSSTTPQTRMKFYTDYVIVALDQMFFLAKKCSCIGIISEIERFVFTKINSKLFKVPIIPEPESLRLT